jgi:hypothetical protein
VFPFDPIELLEAELAKNRRPPDGKLHASSHLDGSLRHIQLELAGAPQLPVDTAAEINLAVGTAIHAIMENATRGLLVMNEVKLDRWLPDGWGGTADCVAWDVDHRCFVLGDWKTQKSGSLHYIHSGGAKKAHIWQVSAYYHALVAAGLPMLKGALVLYIPKSQLSASEGSPVYPSAQEIVPLPIERVHAKMAAQKAAVDSYLASLPWQLTKPHALDHMDPPVTLDYWITDALAPESPRVIALSLNKALKRPVIDVKLVPGWEAAYCPFPDELCSCRHQSANKVGSWDRSADGLLVYTPRKDVEQPSLDILQPSATLVKALVQAQTEKEAI